ncbi:MAG: DnaJ domain-containing protein [Lentisphaerae bacterium]|nr:DnaJ domain-containing protein [Lentisphaerota bacterium]
MVSPWLTAWAGWMFRGPIGGLVGYGLGVLYNALKASQKTPQPEPRQRKKFDYVTSLVVLIAAMMKADGRVTRSELAVVKEFFREHLTPWVDQVALKMLKELLTKDIPVGPVCRQIANEVNYSQRLLLLHMLYKIAHADGVFHPAEKRLLERMAKDMGIKPEDARSIAAMFAPISDANADYTILEIAPDASDEEVRKAYRRMSMKHHPDKVAHLGPELQKSATEKFQQINAAYERIKRVRRAS